MIKDDCCQETCVNPAHVKEAQAVLEEDTIIQYAAETFRIMSDPNRLRMIQILAKQELCVCDIAAALTMTQSAVSHQLRLLRSHRLVKYRRDGKMALYSLDDDHITGLFAQCLDHVKHVLKE